MFAVRDVPPTPSPLIPIADMLHPDIVQRRIERIATNDLSSIDLVGTIRRAWSLNHRCYEEYIGALLLMWRDTFAVHGNVPGRTRSVYSAGKMNHGYQQTFRFARVQYPVPDTLGAMRNNKQGGYGTADYTSIVPRIVIITPEKGKPRLSVSASLVEGFDEAVSKWASIRAASA